MSERVTRRGFTQAGMAAFAFGSLPVLDAAASPLLDAQTAAPLDAKVLDVRPYQLMCVVCRIGEGRDADLGDEKLSRLLAAVRSYPKVPLRLRMNADSVYQYQNSGRTDDTPEGDLFNEKRDLDILQKLGLVPGDTRPAIDMFERLLAEVPTAKGICGYGTTTADLWRGCP
ncbi:MAG: hypothetical protein GXP27_03680, partial [Planctomycetes bacterium]|nr:hypothetical protein [Planctomycetota bacterium]